MRRITESIRKEDVLERGKGTGGGLAETHKIGRGGSGERWGGIRHCKEKGSATKNSFSETGAYCAAWWGGQRYLLLNRGREAWRGVRGKLSAHKKGRLFMPKRRIDNN